MQRTTISKLRNNLDAILRRVRAGHPTVIYDGDVPIARIERIEPATRGRDRLALLCARGLARPPARPLPPWKLRASLPAVPAGTRLADALREDREPR